jgi:hypothetical protein
MRRAPILPLLALGLASACGGDEPSDAERAARREARRDACIAESLHERAHARLASLDTLLQDARRQGSVPAIVSAPHAFAQAYATIADLRAHETAYLDSAAHAATRGDSLRFQRMAEGFRVPPPSPETLEANVQRDYLRDFVQSRRAKDHVCNVLVDGGERPRRER